MDTGLLLLRAVIGLLMVGHGAQKLFGAFGGYGLRGTGGYLAGLGYRPGLVFALVAGIVEAAAGALLALGLGVPVAGALLVATMINVASGHERVLWNDKGGVELPLVLGTVGAALAFTGGGDYALDAALGWNLAGNAWGILALAAGLAAGLGAQLWRHLAASRPGSVSPTTA